MSSEKEVKENEAHNTTKTNEDIVAFFEETLDTKFFYHKTCLVEGFNWMRAEIMKINSELTTEQRGRINEKLRMLRNYPPMDTSNIPSNEEVNELIAGIPKLEKHLKELELQIAEIEEEESASLENS